MPPRPETGCPTSVPSPSGNRVRGCFFSASRFMARLFYFTSGFATLSVEWAETYTYYWQPGVWRHIAACWDKDLMELFTHGKLAAWELKPKLLRVTGDRLGIGSASMELDDLRISNLVRYRVPVRTDGPRRNEPFLGGAGRYWSQSRPRVERGSMFLVRVGLARLPTFPLPWEQMSRWSLPRIALILFSFRLAPVMIRRP